MRRRALVHPSWSAKNHRQPQFLDSGPELPGEAEAEWCFVLSAPRVVADAKSLLDLQSTIDLQARRAVYVLDLSDPTPSSTAALISLTLGEAHKKVDFWNMTLVESPNRIIALRTPFEVHQFLDQLDDEILSGGFDFIWMQTHLDFFQWGSEHFDIWEREWWRGLFGYNRPDSWSHLSIPDDACPRWLPSCHALPRDSEGARYVLEPLSVVAQDLPDSSTDSLLGLSRAEPYHPVSLILANIGALAISVLPGLPAEHKPALDDLRKKAERKKWRPLEILPELCRNESFAGLVSPSTSPSMVQTLIDAALALIDRVDQNLELWSEQKGADEALEIIDKVYNHYSGNDHCLSAHTKELALVAIASTERLIQEVRQREELGFGDF